MDLKEIKQVVDLMKRSSLTEFEIEQEGLKLRIRRETADKPGNGAMGTNAPFPVMQQPVLPQQPAPATPPAEAPAKTAASKDDPSVTYIKSPMVGTFYTAPSPDSDLFVTVGAHVTETSVVCIVEAMKVMNEIQSEVSGTIMEVLVNNGDSVEYGQNLFKVKKG